MSESDPLPFIETVSLRFPRLPSFPILAVALLPTLFAEPTAGATIASWVELVGPRNEASIRVVTDSATCPLLIADGQQLRMQVRAEPGALFSGGVDTKAPVFDIRTCEVTLPEGKTVLLDGKALPLPRHDLQRVVVFGDTGCRIKRKKHGDYDTQDCKKGWPYAKIALHAAAANPDLVIHVGDYVYREVPCPSGNTDCSNSPSGYGWDAWHADFFEPSAPLLAVAPWIMVRGNHETCDRAGDGWFRFLDHAEPPNECEKFASSFVASFGDFGFVVMDSAEAADPKAVDVDDEEEEDQPGSEDLVGTLKSKYKEAGDDIPSQAWLLTHRPFNAVRMHKGQDVVDNSVLQEAIGRTLSPSIRMIVSGHIHMFEALSFGDADPPRPPQLVVGTGGDELGKKPDKPEAINNAQVTDASILKRFGYMVWDRDGAKWKGSLLDEDGEQIAHCKLAERSLTCKKEH
jgi:Calcineurin-like phosphoesterase